MCGPNEKLTKVELAKAESQHLRGTIGEVLDSEATHFEHDDTQVLKFHGIYQQDDRDVRSTRRRSGREPDYSYMVRIALPGGRLTAEQYLQLDEIADAHGDGSLRVTTRQGLQFHGVLKSRLRSTIRDLNARLMSTLGACGDVERNVMTCPAPLNDEAHVVLQQVAGEIARELKPKTRAYHEIWLGEEKLVSSRQSESFYGNQYLPRKFKTAISLATDNCVDVYSCDCGLIAIVVDGRVHGFKVVIGGGLGLSHEKKNTYARLGEALGFIEPSHAVETVRTVAAIFRDHGNRGDRKHARLKYLLEDWGMAAFREEFHRRVNFKLRAEVPVERPGFHDHLGAHQSHDDLAFYGVYIENGRIADRDGVQIRSALRKIVETYQPFIRFTPQQNILLTALKQNDLPAIENILRAHGVTPPRELSAARRYSMACPALPTCGVAITEAERLMPSVVAQFESELETLGLRDVPMTLRMTGCPNGCARPYTADIAFVGRKPGEHYNVYVGGGLAGDRIADLLAADVPADALLDVVRPLLQVWAAERVGDERFGDFYQRRFGSHEQRQKITGSEEPAIDHIPLEVLR